MSENPKPRSSESVIEFPKPAADDPAPELASLADVGAIVSKTTWLWPGCIPNGNVAVVAGSSGIGKSVLVLDFVKRLLDGTGWPDGQRCGRLPFVMWADTEGTQSVLHDRAVALGIPTERIVFPFTKERVLDDLQLDDKDSWVMFRAAVLTHLPRVIVIDSLTGAHSGNEDESRLMTDVLGKLQRLARDTGCAVIVIHHLRKGKDDAPICNVTLNDLRGSGAIGANARAVWAVEPCSLLETDGPRFFRMLKCNLADHPDPMSFELDDERVMWVPLPDDEARRSDREKAREFLKVQLAGGPVPAVTIRSRAAEADIRFRTLRRAKKDLGVESDKASAWAWSMPTGGRHA